MSDAPTPDKPGSIVQMLCAALEEAGIDLYLWIRAAAKAGMAVHKTDPLSQ